MSDDKNFKMVVSLAFLVIFVFMVIISSRIRTDVDFKVSSLDEGNYFFCTASINIKRLFCEKDNFGGSHIINLDEVTQKEFYELIEECPDAIIENGNKCIGNELMLGVKDE